MLMSCQFAVQLPAAPPCICLKCYYKGRSVAAAATQSCCKHNCADTAEPEVYYFYGFNEYNDVAHPDSGLSTVDSFAAATHRGLCSMQRPGKQQQCPPLTRRALETQRAATHNAVLQHAPWPQRHAPSWQAAASPAATWPAQALRPLVRHARLQAAAAAPAEPAAARPTVLQQLPP